MRIVHVIDHFQPWMGYQETYLAREQSRQGHEVTVVTSNRLGNVARALESQRTVEPGRHIEEGIDVVRLAAAFETPTGAGYVWMRGLGSTLESLRPDVVHCHGVLTFTAVQVAKAKHRVGFRLIYDNHMADFNVFAPGESSLKSRAKRAIYPTLGHLVSPLVVRRADAIVAIGEPERAFIRRLFGRSCPEVPIVRLGADSELFTFRPEARERIRSEKGCAEQDVVLGHAGAVRRSKAIDDLIDATGRLVNMGAPIKVLVVGRVDAGYRYELDAKLEALGLWDRVTFEGFVPVESLPDYLSAMDIAVWPGDISNTAIEAMAVGLPVIAARTPYTESVIESHGAGVLFDREDQRQLAAVIEPLMRDLSLRRSVSERARNAVDQDLNWTGISRQFVDLYRGESAPVRVPEVARAAR